MPRLARGRGKDDEVTKTEDCNCSGPCGHAAGWRMSLPSTQMKGKSTSTLVCLSLNWLTVKIRLANGPRWLKVSSLTTHTFFLHR